MKGRPRYHSFVIGKIRESLRLREILAYSLDVGCGTGFSTVALKEISDKVIGLDVSAEMVALAKRKKGIDLLVGSAEELPFDESRFDLITIAQAVHWIDKRSFFAEAGRVLKPDCWIVAYDNYFLGKTADDPDFSVWYRNEFLKIFPSPPRAERSFPAKSEDPKAFVLVREEWHENEIELSARETVDFLLTITNVINAVENGVGKIEEVEDWLLENINPFFKDDGRNSFAFMAPVWYLRQNRWKL